MLLTRSADPIGSDTLQNALSCSDCADCEAALSSRCITCERADRARRVATDPMCSHQLQGWIGSDLYPPR